MDNAASNVAGIVFVFLWAIFCIFLITKFAMNKLAPVKTVKAQVTHKQKQEVFSKYRGKQYKYVVVFSAEGKIYPFMFPSFPIMDTNCMKKAL